MNGISASYGSSTAELLFNKAQRLYSNTRTQNTRQSPAPGAPPGELSSNSPFKLGASVEERMVEARSMGITPPPSWVIDANPCSFYRGRVGEKTGYTSADLGDLKNVNDAFSHVLQQYGSADLENNMEAKAVFEKRLADNRAGLNELKTPTFGFEGPPKPLYVEIKV